MCRAARHGLTLNGKLHRIELQERRLLGVQEGEEAVLERTVKGEQKKKATDRKRKEEVEEEEELLKRSWRKRRKEMCTKSKHKKQKNQQ